MLALDVDVTYQRKPLEAEREQVTVTRSGADIHMPVCEIGNHIARLTGSAEKSDRVLFISHYTPWLKSVLTSISEFRAVKEGWDGADALPPSQGSLDTAEMLATYLNNAPFKPVFSVDAYGRPTFSSNAPDFYVHLTIDDPGQLTLFAEIDGVEHFADQIEFNGRKAPDQLSIIL
ncbi:hypothetical protein [Bradyrhizobium sp. WSM2793]|uniref:hypothetical protein n=1 Tax=Bradyrhizobium sp. WSM2793 TaxID=1038866 RepID=UPI0003718DA6|nr:hypothetical protein [Bradyrhizobium sp. WSM2793]